MAMELFTQKNLKSTDVKKEKDEGPFILYWQD